jgi:hypothetical protein
VFVLLRQDKDLRSSDSDFIFVIEKEGSAMEKANILINYEFKPHYKEIKKDSFINKVRHYVYMMYSFYPSIEEEDLINVKGELENELSKLSSSNEETEKRIKVYIKEIDNRLKDL